MSGLELAKSGVATTVTFVGGHADGQTRVVWATQEIVVVPQMPMGFEPEVVRKLDARTREQVPRDVYVLARRGPDNTAQYRHRPEAST